MRRKCPETQGKQGSGAGLEKSRDFGRGDGRGSGGLVGVVFLLSST
jgi:hypothetical protein